MVRGILIRQLFLLLNVFIVALCVVMGAMAAYRMLRPEKQDSLTLVAVAGMDSGLSRYPAVLSRGAYDALVTGGLFGEAGSYVFSKFEEGPVVIRIDDEPPETQLNLKLRGVIAQPDPASPFAAAIIENLENRSAETIGYSIGDDVVAQVSLVEINPREVILLNARKSPAIYERLSMFDLEEQSAQFNRPTSAITRSAPPASTAAYERITLNRKDMIKEIGENYNELIGSVKPRIAKDASGNVLGITADNIGDIPLAKKLGIQEGDVLSSINNEKIDNIMAIPGIMQKYGNASSVRISILRDGKLKTITYRLQ